MSVFKLAEDAMGLPQLHLHRLLYLSRFFLSTREPLTDFTRPGDAGARGCEHDDENPQEMLSNAPRMGHAPSHRGSPPVHVHHTDRRRPHLSDSNTFDTS